MGVRWAHAKKFRKGTTDEIDFDGINAVSSSQNCHGVLIVVNHVLAIVYELCHGFCQIMCRLYVYQSEQCYVLRDCLHVA